LPLEVADPVATADHERVITRAAIAVVVLLAACQGEPDKSKEEVKWLPVDRAPPPPAPALAIDAGPQRPVGITAAQVEAADAVEAWFKTLAAAARGSQADCVAMARAIESVGAKGRPIVARAKQMEREVKDPAAAAWLADYTKARMEAGYNDLVAAMGLCVENITVKKAMKTIAK
jgi:hypothetical protein